MDADAELLILRSRAGAAGLTDGDLRRLTDRTELVRLRHGAYLPAEVAAVMDAATRHHHCVLGAMAAQRSPAVVSHASAAVLHRLPLWDVALTRVHLTKPHPRAGRQTSTLHVHAGSLDEQDIVLVGGVATTSIARTVLDIARSVSFEQAVVVADAALHRLSTTREELRGELDRTPGLHGNARAGLVVSFADGRSESVGESRSRVGMHRAGLPVPGLQREIRDGAGALVARSDFDWDRLLGEFDGLGKYSRLLAPGETTRDVLLREKRREEALRDLGFEIIRWLWADLDQPGRLYSRILTAIERLARH